MLKLSEGVPGGYSLEPHFLSLSFSLIFISLDPLMLFSSSFPIQSPFLLDSTTFPGAVVKFQGFFCIIVNFTSSVFTAMGGLIIFFSSVL